MKSTLLILLIGLFGFAPATNSKVKLQLSGIESDKGVIRIAVFKTEQDFKDNNAYKGVTLSKSKLNDGKLYYSFDLPTGVYGISAFDDENNNGEMDFNFFHIPTEGYGFSDFYHSSLSRPQFEDFKFTLSDQGKTVKMKFRYL
jgi:uncharacterized protein (DUF2141 family)